MKGFKIASIVCFALTGYFLVLGCALPPVWMFMLYTLPAAIVFTVLAKKTKKSKKARHMAEAVIVSQKSAPIEAVKPIEPEVGEVAEETIEAPEVVEETIEAPEVVEEIAEAPEVVEAEEPQEAMVEEKADTEEAVEVVEETAEMAEAVEEIAEATEVVEETIEAPEVVEETIEAPEAAHAETTTEAVEDEEAQITVSSYVNENGEEEIDLSPFTVFEEKVEYDPSNPKYKFFHATGWIGSIPQRFVDTKMKKCPFCCKTPELWDFVQIKIKSWRGNIDVFRCSECSGTYSISIPDISTALDLVVGYTSGINFANMAVKKKAGKEVHTPYVTFEYVGNSGVSPSIQGKEVRLKDAQLIANRR